VPRQFSSVEIDSDRYFSIMNKLMELHDDVLRIRELLEEDDDEAEEDDDS
jgi:hypothetical protein